MSTPTTNLRDGHSGGHLRAAFDGLIEEGRLPDDATHHWTEMLTERRVTGLLWNCTDIMPGSICDELEMPLGSTYAQGVRRYRRAH